MICPICKITDPKNQSAEFCVQCGADIQVHHLLKKVREELETRNEGIGLEKVLRKKRSTMSVIFQVLPSALLLGCAIFGIFIGMRFLTFLESMESHRISISNKWSEAGFTQLEQMSAMTKEELDLIIDQRQKNQALRKQISKMNRRLSLVEKKSSEPVPKLNVTSDEELNPGRLTTLTPIKNNKVADVLPSCRIEELK